MKTRWSGPTFVDAEGARHSVLNSRSTPQGERIVGFADEPSASDRQVDLPPGYAFPGFVDAHGHLGRLGQREDALSLGPREAVSAMARRVAERARDLPAGTWILGSGWLSPAAEEGEETSTTGLHHRPLSAAAPEHPVCLTRGDAHAVWVNAAALLACGIDASTPDPPGGRILRSPNGNPTGLLVDTAMSLAKRRIPPPSADERGRVILEEAALFASTGVTCVHEMAVDAALLAALRELDREKRLPIRVRAFLVTRDPGTESLLEGYADPPGPQRLRCRGVKLFADGALGSHGARLSRPYPDGSEGIQPESPALMREAMARALRGGWQVAVHAIGDRAVSDTIEMMTACSPGADARWRIEHAQVFTLQDREAMARAGLRASVQPIHAVHDLPWAPHILGEELTSLAYPWRALLDAGIPIGLGADHPIEAVNVPHTLYAAITRRDPDSPDPPPLPGQEQRISREEALHAYWRGGAELSFDEAWLGSLAPGFMADFAVWDTDLSIASPEALRDARCLATVVDGSVVWTR